MSWTNAKFGSVLAKHRDGRPRATPGFWSPQGTPLFIPQGLQDHARPTLFLTGDNAEETYAVILYRNHVIGQFQGTQEVLFELSGKTTQTNRQG